jgi:hypothetical protein
MSGEFQYAPLRIADLSFPQIEGYIGRCPSLILPVGNLEPIGEHCPLGTVNCCCEMIADGLSDALKVAVAPLIGYGNGIPFKSFGGSAGLHRDTLANVIFECCNCWLFQGFKRIMVLTLAMDGKQGIEGAVKRLNGKNDRSDAVRYCSLQEEGRFRSFCSSRYPGTELGRSEWGVLTLAKYLNLTSAITGAGARASASPDPADFSRWHRRGRDPEKLRKMVPGASLSTVDFGNDAEAGRELFHHTVGFLAEDFSPFLIVKDNASR